MQDVSGFGTELTLVASNTFPVGFPVTQYAADTDPIDMQAVEIADKAMGLNGDLIVWARANPVPLTVAVIPGSPADINLQILADANRVSLGKPSASDVIQCAVIYPDGSQTQFSNGRLVNAPFGKSVASSGMQKTRVYSFVFESKTGA